MYIQSVDKMLAHSEDELEQLIEQIKPEALHSFIIRRFTDLYANVEDELGEDHLYWNGTVTEQGNTWAKLEPDGRIRVGITPRHPNAGKIRFIRIKPPGSDIIQGKYIATLETLTRVGPVESPVSGTIDAINTTLRRHPKALNNDPYGEGWVALLKPSNPKELKSLRSGKDDFDWYKEMLKKGVLEKNTLFLVALLSSSVMLKSRLTF